MSQRRPSLRPAYAEPGLAVPCRLRRHRCRLGGSIPSADRNSRAQDYPKKRKARRITVSTSQKGDCWDSAPLRVSCKRPNRPPVDNVHGSRVAPTKRRASSALFIATAMPGAPAWIHSSGDLARGGARDRQAKSTGGRQRRRALPQRGRGGGLNTRPPRVSATAAKSLSDCVRTAID